MTLEAALRQGTAILEQAGIRAPRLTAEVLLAHALGRERTYLYSHASDELEELGWIHYGRYLWERSQGKPTQYITKRQEFYGREFRVTPAVLIPRPETEHVVERTLARATGTIIDAGCGSGAIGVTIALESEARVIGIDVSAAALDVARGNAKQHSAPVEFVQSDFCAAVRSSSCDVLVSNPPYIGINDRDALEREVRDHEPAVALFAGDSGLEAYRRLIADAHRVLAPAGWIVFELGYDSAEGVKSMLEADWRDIAITADLAGIPRVLEARLVR